jgi:hypothetical protein
MLLEEVDVAEDEMLKKRSRHFSAMDDPHIAM